MASVKFKKDGKWSVALEHQISVSADEVVVGLPQEFADKVVAANGGEVVKEKKAVKDTPAKADKKKAESK